METVIVQSLNRKLQLYSIMKWVLYTHGKKIEPLTEKAKKLTSESTKDFRGREVLSVPRGWTRQVGTQSKKNK